MDKKYNPLELILVNNVTFFNDYFYILHIQSLRINSVATFKKICYS